MTQKEFNNTFLPISEKLFSIAFRYLNDREAARDIVQDTYLKLWDIRRKLKKYNSKEAAAFTILKNKCLDRLKLKKWQDKDEINEVIFTGKLYSDEKDLDNKEAVKLIEQLIEQLPEQQKIAVRLRDFDDLSYEEITNAIGQSIETTRVLISRARKKIKEKFNEIYAYEYKGQK